MRKDILLALVLGLTGCGGVEEKKNSLLESAIRRTTGIDTDIDNIRDNAKNQAKIDIRDGGLNLNERFENGFATVTASKETIAVTISDNESGGDNILIGFTGEDLTRMRPIKGKLTQSGENSMSFSTVMYRDNNMDMMTSFDMSGEVVSIHADKVVIKIEGKIGYISDAENPDKWKGLEGTIELNYPIFQALGSAKEDFMY